MPLWWNEFVTDLWGSERGQPRVNAGSCLQRSHVAVNCTPRICLVFHGEALGLVTSVGIHRRYRRWGMILCQDTRFPAQGESVLTDWSGKSPKSRKAVEFRRYLLVRLPPRMSHVGRRGVPSKPPRSSQLLFFSKSRTTSSAVIASSVMAGVKLLCFFALLQISNSSARASTSA